MKLQKQLSRKLGNTEYAKYVVVVAPKDVENLGWKEGEELQAETKGKELVLKPRK